jgi:hypothetical protein
MTSESNDWLVVPNAKPPRTVPELAPKEFEGFLFPRLFAGITSDGIPDVTGRERITDPAERRQLLNYLNNGTLVVDSDVYGRDLLEPTRHYAVRARERTDGTWIWPEAVQFYLRWHGLAPDPDLHRHIVANNYTLPAVPENVARAANAAAREWSRFAQELELDWLEERGLVHTGDETRFSPELNERLLNIGWYKGRNIRDKVDQWLAKRSPFQEFDGPEDLLPYALHSAALDIMSEFGGVLSYSSGAGKTAAKTPFMIYPVTGDEDLEAWIGGIRALGEELETRLFQIGNIQRGQGALVADEDGGIYVVGPINLHAGRNIDEALTRMLEGIKLDRA